MDRRDGSRPLLALTVVEPLSSSSRESTAKGSSSTSRILDGCIMAHSRICSCQPKQRLGSPESTVLASHLRWSLTPSRPAPGSHAVSPPYPLHCPGRTGLTSRAASGLPPPRRSHP